MAEWVRKEIVLSLLVTTCLNSPIAWSTEEKKLWSPVVCKSSQSPGLPGYHKPQVAVPVRELLCLDAAEEFVHRVAVGHAYPKVQGREAPSPAC